MPQPKNQTQAGMPLSPTPGVVRIITNVVMPSPTTAKAVVAQ